LSVNPGEELCSGNGQVVATIERTGETFGSYYVEFSASGKGRQY